jgi:hypothetical protein
MVSLKAHFRMTILRMLVAFDMFIDTLLPVPSLGMVSLTSELQTTNHRFMYVSDCMNKQNERF